MVFNVFIHLPRGCLVVALVPVGHEALGEGEVSHLENPVEGLQGQEAGREVAATEAWRDCRRSTFSDLNVKEKPTIQLGLGELGITFRLTLSNTISRS